MLVVGNKYGEDLIFTEEQFYKQAEDLILFAINEKEYDIKNVSVVMIAEDFTGVVDEDHFVCNKGLKIIEEVLIKFN